MRMFYLIFLCPLLSLNASAKTIDRTAALVNSEVILRSDLDNYKKNFNLRREIDPFIGLLNTKIGADKENLNYLIQESLILQKFPTSEEEIEEEVNSVQRNNKIDREKLKEVLLAQGVRFDDYRTLMRVSVAKRKLVDKELRPLAVISDEQVKNQYYTDRSNQAQRKEQQLVLKYTLQQLLIPNKNLAESIKKRLSAGEDFDAVANETSAEGVESSRLGTISEENMNPKIRQAVQGLKSGESTSAIAAGDGYIILKIVEISAPTDPVFERQKEKIRSDLFQKALLNQLSVWTERERSQSYIHIP